MNSSLHILLVEDDVVDIKSIKRALAKLELNVEMHVVCDGTEAIKFLRREGAYDSLPSYRQPHLIVADLNMPKMNGHELLEALKSDETLRQIPFLVLTTSDDARDVERSYALGAAGYVIKPLDSASFTKAIGVIEQYWGLCARPETRAPRK